ncbi:hypothetical protein F4805DRAFT_472536 [Annulohypoxylon moriforme]|nr:hypothetical protein F4805DRAFT_472536 [Annulohypoxylon moriforme]
MARQQLIKYTAEHHRKEGVSPEAFLKWFQEEHLPNGLPILKKYGITRYAVHTRLPDECTAFRAELDKVKPSWVVSDADLVIEYWLPSLSVLKDLHTDPEWNEKAVKGQDNWLDSSKTLVHIGYETVYMGDGNIFNI